MSAIAQYEQELRNASSSAMDTTPIPQSHSSDMPPDFLTSLPSPLSDSSTQNQLMQDMSATFPNKVDPNDMATSMHVPMPGLSVSAFMSPMGAIDTVPQMRSAPPAYIPDFPAPCDPFTMVQAIEMSSVSPPQSQVPSPSIHGPASSYSVGVTSSLESALDPTGVSGGRSRANTSVSPGTIPASFLSPPVHQPMGISFPPSEGDDLSSGKAHLILGDMLKDIAITASSAGEACRLRHGAEASSKVDELKERISQVSEMFAGMMSVVSLTDSTFQPPSYPPPSDNAEYAPPQISTLSVPEQSLAFPPSSASSSPMDVSSHLNVSDQSRKRCASELEEHRTVKAPKREPQDDAILLLPSVDAPLPAETSLIYPNGAPLHVPTSHSAMLSQSQPSSRPPTPPNSFSTHGPFSSVNPALNYPYVSAQPDFNAGLPPSSASSFPLHHPMWNDNVVPSRHHHSLSAGSLQGLTSAPSPPVAINAMETFPVPPLLTPPLPGTTTVGPPIGRMSRSGSISGTFAHPFAYGYQQPFPESPGAWPSVGRTPSTQTVASNWFGVKPEGSVISASSSASAASEVSNTTRNSPADEEDEDEEGESDDNEGSPPKSEHQLLSADSPTGTSSGSDVPQEYRAEVDRIFFEYLNKICSNLEATDSKGEPIHQTLMAKKMQRLDESPDFRPFKFRIQAFTLAFLEELARQGYPEEKIPMKKIRNYLWRQQYILRFNEDGKKAKSKGNHIWNIEAKKAGDGKWEFRPFHRKLAGSPPSVAYCGLRWTWTPRVWDPQASWQNVPVQYSSPFLPSWLSWNEDVLSGIPPPDAESCQITANAQFVLDGQEGHLTHTFLLTIAPMSTVDSLPFSHSRRPSLAGDPPRRSTSDSVLFQAVQRPKPRPSLGLADSQDTRVIRVLQSVAQRVTEEAESQFIGAPPTQGEFQDLVKQKHVLEQTVNAYDKEISGQSHSQTRRLAVAAQNVVVQAAHTVIADRTAASGGVVQPESTNIQSVTVHELSDATQDAIAEAVKRNGTASTEVDIIVAATSILKARTPGSPSATGLESTSGAVGQQTRSHSAGATGTTPIRFIPTMTSGFPPNPNLPPLAEYV